MFLFTNQCMDITAVFRCCCANVNELQLRYKEKKIKSPKATILRENEVMLDCHLTFY